MRIVNPLAGCATPAEKRQRLRADPYFPRLVERVVAYVLYQRRKIDPQGWQAELEAAYEVMAAKGKLAAFWLAYEAVERDLTPGGDFSRWLEALYA